MISGDICVWNLMCQCRSNQDFGSKHKNNHFNISEQGRDGQEKYIKRLEALVRYIHILSQEPYKTKVFAFQEVPQRGEPGFKEFEAALKKALPGVSLAF
jgi:hypothetical protein